MAFYGGRARIRMLKAAAGGTVWRGGLRRCAVPVLVFSTTTRGVEASSSSSSDVGSCCRNTLPRAHNVRFQRRHIHSLDSLEKQHNPLDLLREVHRRISHEKEYSPVLSSHQRGPSTNISTLESKATVAMTGHFGRMYRTLPFIKSQQAASQCPRRLILQYLARDCGVDREAVDKAVEVYEKVMHGGELTPHLATYSRLHDGSAPVYHDILRYLLLDHACEGMESIICIREDIRTWLRSLQATDQESNNLIAHLKRLDERLQEILSVWFVPGLLEHRRITYETTSASVLEYIVRHEAVHPVSSLRDLRRRLGPDRRVFAIFHPTLTEQPLFVLYVALLPSIPSSMATIQKAEESSDDVDNDGTVTPTVACFYSISNLRKGLVGVGMGEYLIHETVERLQKEMPSLQTFCTLSPIPGFRRWFESDVHRHEWITQEDRRILADALGCSVDEAATTLLDRMESLDDFSTLSTIPGVRQVMMRWVAHYLYIKKHRRKPLDRVARFHISNGAIMDQLHWGADLSPKGWRNSFGLMVTYRYDLFQLSLNQRNFESNNLVPLGESFAQHLN